MKLCKQEAQVEDNRPLSLLWKTYFLFLGGAIFLNPFPQLTTPKEICFYVVTLLTLALISKRDLRAPLRSPIMLPSLLFIFWGWIGLITAIDRANSFHDLYSHLLRYVVLYVALVNMLTWARFARLAARLLILSSALYCGFALYQFYFMSDVDLTTRFLTTRVGLDSLVQIPINIGVIIALIGIMGGAFIAAVARCWRERMLYFVLGLPLLATIYLGQLRGGVLAMLVAVVILLWNRKMVVTVALGFILLTIAFSPLKERFTIESIMNNPRWPIYSTALEVIMDYPVMGIGFGMETYINSINLKEYAEHLVAKRSKGENLSKREKKILIRRGSVGHPHNFILDIAVRTGFVGLGLLVWFLAVIGFMGYRISRSCNSNFWRHFGMTGIASLVVVLVIGLFNPIFSHIPEFYMTLALAMITVAWSRCHLTADYDHGKGDDISVPPFTGHLGSSVNSVSPGKIKRGVV